MPSSKHRMVQMQEAIAHQISIYLQKELGEKYGIVSCNRVSIDNDLRSGKAYLRFFPKLSDEKKLSSILNPHKRMLFRHLADNVPAKSTPRLSFVIDHGDDEGYKINEIIDRL